MDTLFRGRALQFVHQTGIYMVCQLWAGGSNGWLLPKPVFSLHVPSFTPGKLHQKASKDPSTCCSVGNAHFLVFGNEAGDSLLETMGRMDFLGFPFLIPCRRHASARDSRPSRTLGTLAPGHGLQLERRAPFKNVAPDVPGK